MNTRLEGDIPMPSLPTDPQELARAIVAQWKKAVRSTLGALLSLLLVFPPILLAAYLTDSRGLSDFRGDD